MSPHSIQDVTASGSSKDGSNILEVTEGNENVQNYANLYEYYCQFNGEHWDRCYNCKLHFSSVEEASAHFKKTCPHLWCTRCQVTFKTSEDREAHLQHGFAHWPCGVCSFNGPKVDAQEEHWAQTNHRYKCRGCNCWYEKRYWDEHLRTIHACSRCHEHQENEEERKKHEKEHIKAAGLFQCIGRCCREFKNVGDMFSHLESGVCESSINNSDVLQCFAVHQAAEYLLFKDRKGILKRIFEGKEVGSNPFNCPGKGCKENFGYFSSFLRHTAGKKCKFHFNESGPESMLTHMEKNLFVDVAISKVQTMAENTTSGIQVHAFFPENLTDRPRYPIVPDIENLRLNFTGMARSYHAVLKEMIIQESDDIKEPGVLKFRIPKSFNRQLGFFEKSFNKASEAYTKQVSSKPNPRGDIFVYFQSTKMGHPGWKFLGDADELLKLLRVMFKYEMPSYEQYYSKQS
ncbi:hypothetical protein TWF970_003802 [Orbilia oligospora]|uniref:C2H2-type domain-containing protein n=1 Tax=Orbilia oligospora TaxID=2813651 RepID=A0A7C8RB39_ORBOL|nr:hypothetical protein TWF970_003802 [Orbilia oligospora]